MWYDDCITDVMYVCIIMHNMIVEQEGEELTDWIYEDVDAAGPSHDVATANVRMEISYEDTNRVRAFVDMCQQEAHIRLQKDLMEELWARWSAR